MSQSPSFLLLGDPSGWEGKGYGECATSLLVSELYSSEGMIGRSVQLVNKGSMKASGIGNNDNNEGVVNLRRVLRASKKILM